MTNEERELRKKYLAGDVLLSAIGGNFDKWRQSYSLLSISDLIWICSGLYNIVGSQEHFNLVSVKKNIDRILAKENSLDVLELGCWRGHLAKYLLEWYGEIKSYSGYDINYNAMDYSVVSDCRYRSVKMTSWFDRCVFEGDVLISCHTLEHMDEFRLRNTMETVERSSIRYLIFELPFSISGSWMGCNNSHILNLSMNQFTLLIEEYGFSKFSLVETTRESRKIIYDQWMFGFLRD